MLWWVQIFKLRKYGWVKSFVKLPFKKPFKTSKCLFIQPLPKQKTFNCWLMLVEEFVPKENILISSNWYFNQFVCWNTLGELGTPLLIALCSSGLLLRFPN